MTESDFRPCVGDTFELHLDTGRVTIELVEVESLPGRMPQGRQPFSLLFEVKPGYVSESRIYHLEHPRMGTMDILMGPVASNNPALMQLEAVFS